MGTSVSFRLLPEVEHEFAMTRKMLEQVPEEKLSWKPHNKSMTLGRLAGHVAEMPSWALHTLAHDSYDITPKADGSYDAHWMTSRDETLRKFDDWRTEALSSLKRASDEDFEKNWSLTSNGHTLLAMPRGAVFRTVVMNHMIHHRGQLSVYLRLNGVPVPGMYGPSADEDGAVQASA
jgi:uncharacterized damage-inducible protein DinB